MDKVNREEDSGGQNLRDVQQLSSVHILFLTSLAKERSFFTTSSPRRNRQVRWPTNGVKRAKRQTADTW